MSWQYRRHGDSTEDSKVHCRREDKFQCHEVDREVDRPEFRTGQMTQGCFTRNVIDKIAADKFSTLGGDSRGRL
jgi:hypothetical protein